VFQGQSLRLVALEPVGVFELCFDRKDDAINRFDERTVSELREAVTLLAATEGLRGVLVTSAKEVFIVGADITEFGAKFDKPADTIAADVASSNEVFVAFEDLPVPSVCAINGFALGGGLEFALTTSLRVMSTMAQVGVPEVKLGLFPGFGGTVRLSRVAGPAIACEWVAGGRPVKVDGALQAGVVDATAPGESLRSVALDWLRRAIAGEVDWAARQERKRLPVALPADEVVSVFAAAREKAVRNSPPHQPAAAMALEMMQSAAALDRAGALALESRTFAQVASTQARGALQQA
jgi:3-hydroxyacyl-CoA dehydrogenase/enoyl-CoA hydratase/3-hydroxybutyryl-CoA epimerase/enoyl-CoA isomerase